MHKTALEPTAQVSTTALRRWPQHCSARRVFTLRRFDHTLYSIVVAAAIVPHFTEFGNMQSLMYSVAAVGIGAIGMALVTLSGNLFMLSMGATAAVSTVMFAALIHLGLGATLLLVVLSGLFDWGSPGWNHRIGQSESHHHHDCHLVNHHWCWRYLHRRAYRHRKRRRDLARSRTVIWLAAESDPGAGYALRPSQASSCKSPASGGKSD